MTLSNLDLLIFILYVVALLGIAFYISRGAPEHERDAEDYFLAGKSLPWWAIGASLIAANISAEQIIGMSGSGYLIGLAIASYEWMAAITLILVGKFFLPVFLKNNIYTMPQFLEQRFDARVRNVMAVFWIGVYTFVNLTAVLWLGALAINTITGVNLSYGMLFLGGFALAYSLYGGLKAVAFTDIIQVVLLVLGGLFLSYTALKLVSGGEGVIAGAAVLIDTLPARFDMILEKGSPHYKDLPGLSVLIGGLWVMNLSYWGFNQYIIQRALAAKSTREAQKGIIFAAFLKLLMPIIVVLPGIAAVLLVPGLDKADQAYPSIMNLMPVGLKGLIFAALVAAIVSSLASMMNSISTIFTMDLYASYSLSRSPSHYVKVGRVVSAAALLIAMLTAKPLLGQFDQAFQYIQEFTGFFTPGIVALFLLGLFVQRTTSTGALTAAIGSAVLSLAFKILLPEFPFMDRVGLVFVLCIVLALVVSFISTKHADVKPVILNDISFSTSRGFNLGGIVVLFILVVLYWRFW